MKINIEELNSAVSWFRANGRDLNVKIDTYTGILVIKGLDRLDNEVEIHLYNEQAMMPKIKNTQILK